jgi:peptidoglycan hydrolase-like protein with peptidoglycan-binding domain
MRPGESFVQQPVRSLQTMLRVIAEDDPSLPTVVPDGIYGPSTMVAVTAFQRKSGIPVTGIVDEITWDRIAETYEPALIRVGKAEPIEILLEPGEIIVIGQSSPYVYLLQGMLAQLSGDHQTILYPALTGTLDTDTADSLRAFQLLAGLPATGTLDKITWRHLVKQFSLNAVHNSTGKRS